MDDGVVGDMTKKSMWIMQYWPLVALNVNACSNDKIKWKDVVK